MPNDTDLRNVDGFIRQILMASTTLHHNIDLARVIETVVCFTVVAEQCMFHQKDELSQTMKTVEGTNKVFVLSTMFVSKPSSAMTANSPEVRDYTFAEGCK